MSAVEQTTAATVPETTPIVDAAAPAAAPVDAPVIPSEQTAEAVVELPKAEEEPKTEAAVEATDAAAVAPVEENKAEAAAEEKIIEPIYSGALGYKAPGLKK
jgi:hypothetical protein